jgi:NAD(P)-dependent dehydrogenase (short-subunit alcohol dehydrogenase family)
LSSGERPQRVCLLTGAAGTFGQEFCRRNADGYSIAAVYHHTAPALASQETTFFDPLDPTSPVPENDHPVFAVQADLSTPAGCEWAVRATLERFGCIDVVVHAAVHSVWGGVLEGNGLLTSAEEQLAVNVLAPLRLSSSVALQDWTHHDPADNRRVGRNIVSLSSTAGLRLYEHSGQTVYAASKAALNHLSVHLADELADIGVRVNVVAPDSFPEAVPVAEVVDAVTWLDGADVTGKILVLDHDRRRWLTPARSPVPAGGR